MNVEALQCQGGSCEHVIVGSPNSPQFHEGARVGFWYTLEFASVQEILEVGRIRRKFGKAQGKFLGGISGQRWVFRKIWGWGGFGRFWGIEKLLRE